MSFLAPVPGLLPALVLIGLLVALLLLPPLVLGGVVWLAFAGLRLAARLTSRAVARFYAYATSSGRRPHVAHRARTGAYRAADRYRLLVLIRWAFSFATHGRGARPIAGEAEALELTPTSGSGGRATERTSGVFDGRAERP